MGVDPECVLWGCRRFGASFVRAGLIFLHPELIWGWGRQIHPEDLDSKWETI